MKNNNTSFQHCPPRQMVVVSLSSPSSINTINDDLFMIFHPLFLVMFHHSGGYSQGWGDFLNQSWGPWWLYN